MQCPVKISQEIDAHKWPLSSPSDQWLFYDIAKPQVHTVDQILHQSRLKTTQHDTGYNRALRLQTLYIQNNKSWLWEKYKYIFAFFLSFLNNVMVQVAEVLPSGEWKPFMLLFQYHGCWWPGDTKNQGPDSILEIVDQWSTRIPPPHRRGWHCSKSQGSHFESDIADNR